LATILRRIQSHVKKAKISKQRWREQVRILTNNSFSKIRPHELKQMTKY
jgi:hypothetical protein